MKVIGKDRTSCDVCNPIDEILARLDALERRASAIVAKVQGLAPDGEGNVTLPTSSSDTDPLHGRIDAFAMSSEVKEAADDAHAYAASIADDVLVINSEIDALNQAVEVLQPAEIEAIKSAVQTLQTTVATLESTVDTLNNSVAGKVSKSGDAMNATLTVYGVPFGLINRSLIKQNEAVSGWTRVYQDEVIDSDGKTLGYSQRFRTVANDGSNYDKLSLGVCAKGGVKTSTMGVVCPENGDGYADAPSWSPGTNDNSDKILTIKMANSLPSLMHTTGNETIGGLKTFDISPVVPSTPSDATGMEIATANWVIAKINELATKNRLTGL